MTIYTEPHTIEVYTLAESAVLIALLQNALSYAAEPTFGAPIIETRNIDTDAVLEDLLARAETAGVRLYVKRIFKPLKKSAFPQYNRHYYDNAIRNLRILLEKHPDILSFTATDGLQEDLGVLLFRHFRTRQKKFVTPATRILRHRHSVFLTTRCRKKRPPRCARLSHIGKALRTVGQPSVCVQKRNSKGPSAALRGQTPILPVRLIVKNLKARSSRVLREEYPYLKKRVNAMWTRSYYCETIGNISEETIRKYIANQKRNVKSN